MPADLLPVPLIPQSHDGDCLPACAAMVLSYWGQPRSLKQITRLLGTESFGTPPSRIQRLSRWGYNVLYRQATIDDLSAAIASDTPPIVMLKTGFLDYWHEVDVGHAVVVLGIENGYVYVNDPAFPDAHQRSLIDGFIAACVERNEMAAFIRPR